MISAWELYLWTRFDAVNKLAFIVMLITVVALCVDLFFCMVRRVDYGKDDSSLKTGLTLLKKFFWIPLLACLIFTMLPSKKDAAMIWIVPQLATVENAELLKGEAAEIYKLAKQALTESLDINETQEIK